MKKNFVQISRAAQSTLILLVLCAAFSVAQAQVPVPPADEGIAALSAQIAAAPGKSELYVERGTLYTKIGKFAEALADFNQALEIDPKIVAAYSGRARVYEKQKSYKKAIDEYTLALQNMPPTDKEQQAAGLVERGKAFQLNGDLTLAAGDFYQVARSNAKIFGEAAYLLGSIYFERKDYAQAGKAFARSMEGKFAPAEAKLRESQTLAQNQSSTSTSTDPKTPDSGGTTDEFLSLTTSALNYLQETKVYKDKYESPKSKSGKEGHKEALELAEILHARSQQTVETLTALINRFSGTNYPPELIQTRGKLESLLATNKRTINDMAGAKIFHRILILSYESEEKEKALENQVRAAEKAGDGAAREAAYNKYVAQIKTTDKIVAGGGLEIGVLIKSLDQQFVTQDLRNLEIILSTTASQATVKIILINRPPQKN